MWGCAIDYVVYPIQRANDIAGRALLISRVRAGDRCRVSPRQGCELLLYVLKMSQCKGTPSLCMKLGAATR